MSDSTFLLVFIALGFVILLYFNTRSRNFSRRHPRERNAIDYWLTGKDDHHNDGL